MAAGDTSEGAAQLPPARRMTGEEVGRYLLARGASRPIPPAPLYGIRARLQALHVAAVNAEAHVCEVARADVEVLIRLIDAAAAPAPAAEPQP